MVAEDEDASPAIETRKVVGGDQDRVRSTKRTFSETSGNRDANAPSSPSEEHELPFEIDSGDHSMKKKRKRKCLGRGLERKERAGARETARGGMQADGGPGCGEC